MNNAKKLKHRAIKITASNKAVFTCLLIDRFAEVYACSGSK